MPFHLVRSIAPSKSFSLRGAFCSVAFLGASTSAPSLAHAEVISPFYGMVESQKTQSAKNSIRQSIVGNGRVKSPEPLGSEYPGMTSLKVAQLYAAIALESQSANWSVKEFDWREFSTSVSPFSGTSIFVPVAASEFRNDAGLLRQTRLDFSVYVKPQAVFSAQDWQAFSPEVFNSSAPIPLRYASDIRIPFWDFR